MSFNKTTKIISVILSISLVLGVAAVCIGVSASSAVNNLLSNASFESTYGIWNGKDNTGNDGYTGKLVGIGQRNLLAENWFGTNERGTRIAVNHTSDAADGEYAFKFDVPSDVDTVPLTFYIKSSGFRESSLTRQGNFYKFTAWIKGSNQKSYFEIKTTDGTVYRYDMQPTAVWQRVTIDNIFLSKDVTLEKLYDTGLHLKLVVNGDKSEKTELYVDNLSLSVTDNVFNDGSFENSASIGGPGYTAKIVSDGQTNSLTDAWAAFNYWPDKQKDKAITVDHSENSRSGKYSLHFNIPKTADANLLVFPKTDAHDFSKIEEGYYSFSVWVKTTGRNSKLVVETDDKTYEKLIPASIDWQKVSLDSIYLEDGAKNLDTAWQPDGQRAKGAKIEIVVIGDKDFATELYIDDVSLTQIEFMSNPDFEKGDFGWAGTSDSGATAESVKTDAQNGNRALKLTLPAKSSITVSETSLPKSGFNNGYYMLAFYAKGSGNLSVKSVQGSNGALLNCDTLKDDWQLFVKKDIRIDEGGLESLEFIAKNTAGSASDIYIDNVQFYRQVGPGGYIDALSAKITSNGELALTAPPEGYDVSVLSSSDESVISLDGTVNIPEEETNVDLVLNMVNINDPTDDAKSEPISVKVLPKGAVESGGNHLLNGSFEQAGENGFTDKLVGNGQHNVVVSSWKGGDHWFVNNDVSPSVVYNDKKIYIDHTTDAKDGEYALLFKTQSSQRTPYINFYPYQFAADITDITMGQYTLSLWVKGDNKNSFVSYTTYDGINHKVYFSDYGINEDDWTLVEIKNIQGFSTKSRDGALLPDLFIQVKGGTQSSQLLIDNVVLENTGKINIVDDTILQNASFERNKLGAVEFENVTYSVGAEFVLESWKASVNAVEYGEDIAVTHTADASDGDYALKFSVPQKANTLTLHTLSESIRTDIVTDGLYTLSFYTKGINRASSLTVKTESDQYTAKITPVLDWTKVTLNNIHLTDGAANLSSFTNAAGESVPYILFEIASGSGEIQQTEIYIDNILLEKTSSAQSGEKTVIIDGGFETPTPAEIKDISLSQGGHGQYNILTNTGNLWAHQSMSRYSTTITRTTDSHTGKYALRTDVVTANNDTKQYFVRPTNIKSENLTPGTYSFSCWVKGTNTGSYLAFGNQKVYVPQNAADGWVKISVDNIVINSIDDLGLTGSNAGDNTQRYSNLKFVVSHKPAGSYIIVDDFSLTLSSAADGEDDNSKNLLVNAGLETADTLWNDNKNDFGATGFSNFSINNGQHNSVADYWIGCEHWIDGATAYRVKIDHTTDAHSGEYALRFKLPAKGKSFRIYTNKATVSDTSTLTGQYELSFWVKGNNTNSEIWYYDSAQKKNVELADIPVTSEWTKVTFTLPEINVRDKNVFGFYIRVQGSSSEATDLYIDDISLIPAQ